MASEYEHAIRDLIRQFVSERDPVKLKLLASELEKLLRSEADEHPHLYRMER